MKETKTQIKEKTVEVRFWAPEDALAWVEIQRPKQFNAINQNVLESLRDVLEELKQKKSLRAVFLRGSGNQAFVAGADIESLSRMEVREAVSFSRLGHEVFKKITTFPVPVIACVHGFALGGGTELACACDWILASEKAVFGQPEVGLGLIPGFGGTFRLAQFVGWAKAREMVLTGRKIDAQEALQSGLVQKLFAHERFWEEVTEYAKVFLKTAPLAVRVGKKLMRDFSSYTTDVRIDAEAHVFGALFHGSEPHEGTRAFLKKEVAAFVIENKSKHFKEEG